jgi:hypothetical protein
LHRDKVVAVGLVHIKDGADVRVIERRSQAGFAFKAFQVGFLDGEFGRQNFDDDRAAEFLIGGFIHRALTAGADLLINFVVA